MSLALRYWMGDTSLLHQTHIWNDLYCVEWDVKLYYTIPYHTIPYHTRDWAMRIVIRECFKWYFFLSIWNVKMLWQLYDNWKKLMTDCFNEAISPFLYQPAVIDVVQTYYCNSANAGHKTGFPDFENNISDETYWSRPEVLSAFLSNHIHTDMQLETPVSVFHSWRCLLSK